MRWQLAEPCISMAWKSTDGPRVIRSTSWATSWCAAMFVATVPPEEPLSRALLLRLMRPFRDTKY
jgi:hypothetical protein